MQNYYFLIHLVSITSDRVRIRPIFTLEKSSIKMPFFWPKGLDENVKECEEYIFRIIDRKFK